MALLAVQIPSVPNILFVPSFPLDRSHPCFMSKRGKIKQIVFRTCQNHKLLTIFLVEEIVGTLFAVKFFGEAFLQKGFIYHFFNLSEQDDLQNLHIWNYPMSAEYLTFRSPRKVEPRTQSSATKTNDESGSEDLEL